MTQYSEPETAYPAARPSPRKNSASPIQKKTLAIADPT